MRPYTERDTCHERVRACLHIRAYSPHTHEHTHTSACVAHMHTCVCVCACVTHSICVFSSTYTQAGGGGERGRGGVVLHAPYLQLAQTMCRGLSTREEGRGTGFAPERKREREKCKIERGALYYSEDRRPHKTVPYEDTTHLRSEASACVHTQIRCIYDAHIVIYGFTHNQSHL